MDGTLRNMSQLEDALSKMGKPSDQYNQSIGTPSTPTMSYDNYPNKVNESYHSTPHDIKDKPQSSAYRTGTSQMSTSSLLTNIAGLQTSTNQKLEKLTNAVYGLHNLMERSSKEQIKQTELLTTIARNSANMKMQMPQSPAPTSGEKVKSGSIKEYGFSTSKHVFSEFLLKLLKQIEIKIISKDRSYTSTRDFNQKLANQVIKMAMDNKFKINGVVEDKIDANGQTHPSLVKVASSIGSVENTNPVLSPESLREICEDPDSRFFVSCFKRIMDRLKIIKVLLPFYEADIITSIEYPYFSKSGDLMCTWDKIKPRSETSIEASVMTASLSSRNKLAELLAKGIAERSAISAAIRS